MAGTGGHRQAALIAQVCNSSKPSRLRYVGFGDAVKTLTRSCHCGSHWFAELHNPRAPRLLLERRVCILK